MNKKRTKSNNNPLLTVQQAAEYLGVNPGTIRRWARDKQLQGVKVGTRGDWRFTKKALSLMIIPQDTFTTKGSSQETSDIKDPAQAQDRIEVLLSSIDDHLVTYDSKWRFTFVNDAGARVLGKTPHQLLGKSIWKLFPEAIGNQYYKQLHQAARTKRPIRSEHYYAPFDQWFENHIYPFDGGVTVFATDITERKRTEESLFESEQRFRVVVENSTDLIALIDIHKGTYIYVSPSHEQILGYKPVDMLGKNAFDMGLFHPEDLPALKANMTKLKRGRQGALLEFRVKHKNGDWITVEGGRKAVLDKKGKPFLIIAVARDITDRKRGEEALRESEASLSAAQRLAKMGSWEFDLALPDKDINKNELRWSDECFRVFGFKPGEVRITNDFFFSLVHPQDQEKIQKAVAYAIKHKKEYAIEHRIILRDGSERIIFENGKPIFDKNGKPVKMMGTAQDITDQKLAREKLEYYASLSRSIHDAVISIDSSFHIKSWNKGAEVLYGWKEKEVLGKLGFDVLPTRYVSGTTRNDVLEAMKKKGLWQGEVIQKRKNGEMVNILSVLSQVKNSEGNTVGIVAVNRDISERKKLERQKDDFMSIASHELKTPVTSVKAYTQVLHQLFSRKGDIKSAELLKKMDNQLNKLNSLIGDLLDVTKIQGGKLQFNETYFDFNELVGEIVEEIQRTTEKHTLVIHFDNSKTMYGDRDRIGQVITNFLTNGIKYSPDADKIIIKTKTDKASVTVSVQDFGVGISKDKQDKIFERFYRIPEDKVETIPGIGLGLYISSEIIKRQGGKIWVKSTKGKGSTFFFQLPIRKKLQNHKLHLDKKDSNLQKPA